MSKLQQYSLIKKDTSYEEYLTLVQNTSDRIAMSKFRLSNHTLLIETGRHQGIPRSDRKCPFCPQHIEDEFHFLIHCPTYKTLRYNLFEGIKEITFGFYYPEDEKFLFWFLLKNPIISHLVARFIKNAMEIRTFLVTKPRNNC